MPKRTADRQWVNREDRVDRAWPRDHLPSSGARRTRADAAKPTPAPDEDAAATPERATVDESATAAPPEGEGSEQGPR